MKASFKQLGCLVLGVVLLTFASSSYPKVESRKINEKQILEQFTKVYAQKSKPRLTIAVNRELSEQVSEYKVSSKMAAEITGKVKTGQKDKPEAVARNLLPEDGATAAGNEAVRPEAQGVTAEPAKSSEARAAESEKAGSASSQAEAKPVESGSTEGKPLEAKPSASSDAKPEAAKKPEADASKPEEQKTESASSEEPKSELGKPSESAPAKPEENKAEAAEAEETRKTESAGVENKEAKIEPAGAAKSAEPEVKAEPAEKAGQKSEPEQPAAASVQAVSETSHPEVSTSSAAPASGSLKDMSREKVAQAAKDVGPQYGPVSSDSAAMAMKMESVEIRSDLPEKEREAIFSEGMMWKFQNAFVEPFLEVKAKIVDRATIIRQTGLEEMKGKSIQEIDRMAIEMNALNKYTDVYIEILITQDMNSTSGYIFKADAKDLKSGEIVAHTVYEGLVKEETKNVVVNPATGKTVKKKMKILDVETSGRNLALLLMQDMTKTWSE